MSRTAQVAGVNVNVDPRSRARQRRLRIVRRDGQPTRLEAKTHARPKRPWPVSDPAFWLALGHGGA
ncbi:MAG TPA: hypothetical protein VKZ50_15245 [bacterium]|nr:hypothetical protein [bacterium]